MTREMTVKEYADETARSYNVLRLMRLPDFIRRDKRGKIYDADILDEFLHGLDALDDEADDAAHGFGRVYRIENEDTLRAINQTFLKLLHEEALATIRQEKGRPDGMTGAASLEATMTTEARTTTINGDAYETT